MGLRITRTQGDRIEQNQKPGLNSVSSSVWSAKDMCPMELQGEPPIHVEKVVPDANGHMGAETVAMVFDRLWKIAENKTQGILELDMSEVKTVDPRFQSELEFFQNKRRAHGLVQICVTHWNDA